MNKKLMVLVLSMITASSMINADDEPVLAEAVEMPGNVVGSLFGGGYAKRSHDKKEEETKSKKRKRSKKDSDQKSNRSRRRPTEERS